jgi:hypothetical protein
MLRIGRPARKIRAVSRTRPASDHGAHYYFGVTVSTAEVVSTIVLFMTVDAETVKLPGHAHFGIRTGNEKLWEVFGGNANGGV